MLEAIVRNPAEKIWVTRSTNGQYVNHFLTHGLAAIGHLDRFNLMQGARQGTPYQLGSTEVESLLCTDSEMSKAQRTSHLSQIRQFVKEMAIGDMIVTLDSQMFAVGRVAGFAYFDDSPLPIKVGRELKSLPYQLRIPVEWGPRFPRKNLPLPLERVFFSHRTVFDVTDYWQYIYHILYPAFLDGDNLFLSLFIGQNDDIRTKDISRLINILTEFEELASIYSDDQYFETLTLKASFFSKGPFWPRLKAKEKKTLLYLAFISAVLSGAEVGPVKIKGVLNTDTAKAISEKLFDILKENNASEVKKRLDIGVPKGDSELTNGGDLKPKNQQVILWAGA